ncbi:MAG: helix-turn-helix transcriptional regulator [Alphaproteobacteria bacterium]|nr:helix-turn-helix transcriptional regulator [Alphaproteobacteria bacterium]MBL7097811.1 helix-turn-helix transcriptional regulator [Alphaproteobacteria bacterium]
MSLARVLSEVRALRGHSLRAVEEATGISNAYLSQLERGDAQRPSPDKLLALSKFYDVPYTDLMRAAGYLQRTEKPSGGGKDTSAIQAALMSADLTPDEEAQVVKYIQFLRFQSRK